MRADGRHRVTDDVDIVVTGLRLQVTEPTLAAGANILAPDSAVGSTPEIARFRVETTELVGWCGGCTAPGRLQ